MRTMSSDRTTNCLLRACLNTTKVTSRGEKKSENGCTNLSLPSRPYRFAHLQLVLLRAICLPELISQRWTRPGWFWPFRQKLESILVGNRCERQCPVVWMSYALWTAVQCSNRAALLVACGSWVRNRRNRKLWAFILCVENSSLRGGLKVQILELVICPASTFPSSGSMTRRCLALRSGRCNLGVGG